MKKILIIGIVALVILLIAISIFYVIRKNTEEANQAPDKAPAQVFAPVLPGTEMAKIDTQNLAQSVQKNIENAETSGKETLDTKFQDAASQSLTLEQFRAATKIKIPSAIYENLSQTDYSLFTCSSNADEAEGTGLIMRFKPGDTSAYYASIYKKMRENMAGWESTIFSDLAPLFFSEKKISQASSFKATKYVTKNEAASIDARYANVKSDDGVDLSLDYAIYAEDVYIFNNPQCLRKALDKYQPALDR